MAVQGVSRETVHIYCGSVRLMQGCGVQELASCTCPRHYTSGPLAPLYCCSLLTSVDLC